MRYTSLLHGLREDWRPDLTRNVLVGVSGGADSLCLLHVLRSAGLRLVVVHVNHQLRPQAHAEMLHVQQLAQAMGIPCVALEVDVRGYATANRVSLEDAARTLRYRSLFEQAALHQAQAVAVGHTADDQVETVLMNFLRGSGLNGLKGMQSYLLPNAWSQEIPLVRPLLDTWRKETEAYCQEHHLQYVMDESNQDTHYRRNRIRHEVIPFLEQINPELRPALLRMAQALRSDQQIVEQAVTTAWDFCILSQHADWVVFDLPKLGSQPIEIQRQLLRRALGLNQAGLRDIDFESVQRALAYLASPPRSGQSDLAGGMRLLFEADRLWVARWEAELPGWQWPEVAETLSWNIPGELRLPGGWTLQARWVEEAPMDLSTGNADPYQAFLDLGDGEACLAIRPRQAGDRYQPLGMENGSLKVSDYMINQKIPRRARAHWPLVCWQGQVAWVPGGAPAHPFRVRSMTRRAAWLRLTPGELL